jgi:hypothetical protein
LFNDVALRVRALAWTGSLPTWRLMHDVYCIQHEEEYCGRWRGLIMHLGGVCWALEHNGSERGYRALQKLVERDHMAGMPYPPPPGIPKSRGEYTAASLKELDQPELLTDGVDRWARSAGWPMRRCNRSLANGSSSPWGGDYAAGQWCSIRYTTTLTPTRTTRPASSCAPGGSSARRHDAGRGET